MGPIVGGVVGGLAALGILGALLLYCIRRKRNADDFDGNFDPDRVVGHSGGGGGTLPQVDLGEGVVAEPYAYHPAGTGVGAGGGMTQYGEAQYPIASGGAGTGVGGPRSAGTTSPSAPSHYPTSSESDAPAAGMYYNNPNYPNNPDVVGMGMGMGGAYGGGNQPTASVSSGSNYTSYGGGPGAPPPSRTPAPGGLYYDNPMSSKEREALAQGGQGRYGLATQVEEPNPQMVGLGGVGRGHSAQGSVSALSSGTGSGVVVHQDGGRVPQPQPQLHEMESEIPPTYDSIPADERA